jgi:4-hydroxy-tetrahydrodipicolinate reductase
MARSVCVNIVGAINPPIEEENRMARKRVVVWGTGPIGMPGLRALIDHPEYELVGLHAWSPDKVGRDAGEIAGMRRTGIIATDDVAALLALKADCLVYQGNYAHREAQCVADVVPFLEAGTNCVTPALMDLIAPRYGRQQFVEPIAAACANGRSSIFCGGTDPGYMTIGHLFSLLSGAGQIECVKVAEIADLQKYAGVDSMAQYGFNMPLDYLPEMYTDDVGRAWHESTLWGIADYLGVKLDEITSNWETAGLDYGFQAAFGEIKPGHTSAIRWTMTGVYKGKPLIVYRKIERIHRDAGPEFEQPMKDAECGYQITITGAPSYHTEMALGLYDGCSITALHPINAINAVCDAQPGIYGQLDLPVFYSKNIVR